ncbi:sugar ABC transporter permease [Halanaerobiaceae bacterium Z-7014]|uniref:Sugar ABC transporter permease n=1 Tax=Halonatronomonas betaini TaxID=2778430 RepID=A0A931F670_9FIRM|nr:sugar ABC transporter permease [Halonatronomonas betaini]MBF8436600.1 sugar ABC transporter permease [Halonatronomonas betaini]
MANNSSNDLARQEARLAYKLLAPAAIILLLVALYPLGQVFYTSMTDRVFASGQEVNFIGFDNYRQLLSMRVTELPPQYDDDGNVMRDDDGDIVYERPIQVLPREPRRFREVRQFSIFGTRYVIGASNPTFIGAITNTVLFTVISVFLETVLGLLIALVVNSNFKGRGAMRAIMLVPWAIITVVSARMWEWMLASSRVGIFNTLLRRFDLIDESIAFLQSSTWQLPSMIAVDVWKTTPFMALLILAGLQLIPNELYEAARVDGASKVRQFFAITLPLIKPSLAVALIFRTLDALRVFDVFQVLLAQSRYSMASYNYFQLINNRAMGLSSAIGVVIFVIIFAFAMMYIKALGVDAE